MNLFDPEPLEEKLTRFGVSKRLLAWAPLMDATGSLDPFLWTATLAGARTEREIYEFLDKGIQHFSSTRKGINLGDFKSRVNTRSYAAMVRAALIEHGAIQANNSEKATGYTTTIRNFGSKAHLLLQDVIAQNHRANFQSLSRPQTDDLPLDHHVDQQEFDLGEPEPLLPKNWYPDAITVNGRISQVHLNRLHRHWSQMAAALNQEGNWHTKYSAAATGLTHLRRLLLPILGNEIRPNHVKKNADACTEYLEMLTLMSISVQIFQAAEEEVCPVYTEIPPIDRKRYGFNGGRIDFLKVHMAAGFPTRTRNSLCRMALHNNPRSAGHALHQIRTAAKNRDVNFELGDWKMVVGDKPGGSGIIEVRHVEKQPFTSHLNQVKDYLSLATLDCRLAENERADPWKEDDGNLSEGKIIYLFPNREQPIVHIVRMTLAEKRSRFERLMSGLGTAISRAELREMTQFMASWAKNQIQGTCSKTVSAPSPIPLLIIPSTTLCQTGLSSNALPDY